MKNYKDLGIYDFSDYAEEITGDDLFKVNGGAQVANTNQGVANAHVGDTVTRNDGTTVTITQGDINWAQQQIDSSGSSGNNAQQQGPGSSGSGYNPGGASGASGPSAPDIPDEIKSNPDAYNYYMSLQGKAKEEGAPDKYKGYNVLGAGKVQGNEKKANGNWIRKTVNGIDEYYYDNNIKSQGEIVPDGFQLDGIKFNKDGTLSDLNGKVINQIEPIQKENYDIFVSRKPSAVNPNTLHNNLFGTSYTGPDNPKTYAGNETYDYIPHNRSELASMDHDKAYGKKGAAGVSGALFNTDVIGADFKLVGSNFINSLINPDPADKSRSLVTGVAFTLLGTMKSVIWAFKPENQPDYGIPMTIEERYHAHH